MAYNLITTPETERDIENAIEYYLGIRDVLAKEFLMELKAVKRIFIKTQKKFKFVIKTFG